MWSNILTTYVYRDHVDAKRCYVFDGMKAMIAIALITPASGDTVFGCLS